METVSTRWKRTSYCLLFLSALQLSGCTDYWWTRGQPPSVSDLLTRSSNELEQSRQLRQDARPLIADLSREIENSFSSTLSALDGASSAQLEEALSSTQTNFIALEGLLSVGSRAAHAELSGQLRAIGKSIQQGSKPSKESVGLLASRTYTFLVSELSVPAP